MIDYSTGRIAKVAVHTVGNKTNDEELTVSRSLVDITDTKVTELLFKFFLTPFTVPEFYSFTSADDDFESNPLFVSVSQMFENSKMVLKNSIGIAKHLYEVSENPQIKSGDLFVAYFSNISVEGELTDAIGIFKSENKQSFLKVENDAEVFSIQSLEGINIEKLDKGCLIFNTDKELGYKICIVDKSNKLTEAEFWKESFLQLKPCSNDYSHTKEVMNLTKNFVTKQLAEEFDVSRTDQIDMLNRSVNYFKTHDTFEKDDFENEVLQDKNIIKSFRNFDETYRSDHDIEDCDSFDISEQAVKKQSKLFKSILKLDKNFHIYIHGNRELIEQGTESDGRKYYKIYYKEEA